MNLIPLEAAVRIQPYVQDSLDRHRITDAEVVAAVRYGQRARRDPLHVDIVHDRIRLLAIPTRRAITVVAAHRMGPTP